METVADTVRFARAPPASLVSGISALMNAHWQEVSHYRDMPLEPDFGKYAAMEAQGMLRTYGAWKGERLVGYAVWLLGMALHYRSVRTAQESTVYLAPEVRDLDHARAFDTFVEADLSREGIEIFTKHIKVKYNPRRAQAHLRWLNRHGYELQDYVLTKRASWPG